MVAATSVKQGIKYCVGAITFGIGAKALYDYKRGKVYSKYATAERALEGTAFNLAQASFVLSATVTPVGVWMISAVVNRALSSAQLEKVFGPYTTFEGNWKHPRHIVSLISVSLALPLLVNRIVRPCTSEKQQKIARRALFVVLTSRPVLHIGNQLAQKVWSRTFK